MPPFALAGGWWIFLIFVIVFLFAVSFGYYTVKGSGVNLRPYRRAGGPSESPPQVGHDITTDVRNWGRGTEGRHRQYPSTATFTAPPEVAEALTEWRASDREAHLEPPIGADDHIRGPDGAQTVTLYVDLDAEPGRGVIRLADQLGQERPLRVAIRHLPLADVHEFALSAAEALEAAGAQGRFFEALDALAQRGFGDQAELIARSSESVPDPERLRGDVEAGRFRSTVIEHIRRATASGVRGVPAVFIDGKPYDGALTAESLRAALEGREWRAGSRNPKSAE